jgi:uncharacterized protein YtpQ (UPF0354 family)
VREAELASWGMQLAQALASARENLLTRSQAARIVRTESEHGPFYVARTGDGRDSARVLLPALYAELAERTGEHIAIGVPHRDTFMACDAGRPALVEALAARVREDAARAPHKLSERLYALTPVGLRELA